MGRDLWRLLILPGQQEQNDRIVVDIAIRKTTEKV
jgi:hypothetical protein